jgi:hypothetical protein
MTGDPTLEVETKYVKCHHCGWLHFAVSAKHARTHVESMSDYLGKLTIEDRASFSRLPLDAYMQCFSCGADSAGFLEAQEADAPLGVTIQPVVVERG